MTSDILRKLVSAGDRRRSRFHTEDDQFIGWRGVVAQTPRVVVQKLRTRVTGTRSQIPWWPLPAIDIINNKLSSEMAAIEFGSGSSTLWIAKRVRTLLSRDHDEQWVDTTRSRLLADGLRNCSVEHRSGEAYFQLEKDQRFHFAVVDGEYRWKCLEALANRMEPGGLIYFDNSDSDKDASHYGEYGLTGTHHAQAFVRRLQDSHNVRVESITGMIHGELFAGSGILISFYDGSRVP